MPDNFLYAVMGVAVLVTIAVIFDWLLSHIFLVLLIAFVVGMTVYLIRRRNIARYRR